MVRKRGIPQQGELVICKIDKLSPNSATAILIEYNLEGMIHISEVFSGWVRDIRNHIKSGQQVVAKVTRIDEERKFISLSLKRVDNKQEKDKIKEYNLEQKAEKMLEMAAKTLKKDLDTAYEEIGFLLQENFGSIYEGFKKSIKNPAQLSSRGISETWIKAMQEIAEKNIEQKEFEFKAKLFIKSYEPNGLEKIKKILLNAEKSGLEIKYIAAPEYLVKFKTKNAKKGEKEFTEKLTKLSKEGDIKFEMIE